MMTDYVVEIPTQYRDTDAMGHVNNAVSASFVEHAALEFFTEFLDVPIKDVPFAVVRLELDFEGQLDVSDAVTSAVTVADVGDR